MDSEITKLRISIILKENYERDDQVVINHIGRACYLDFNKLTSEELINLGKFKKAFEVPPVRSIYEEKYKRE